MFKDQQDAIPAAYCEVCGGEIYTIDDSHPDLCDECAERAELEELEDDPV